MNKVPKLRFPEFSGEWKESELSELINIISGYAFKSELFGNDGEKLVIPKNFTKNGTGLFNKENTKYTLEKVEEKYSCKEGDLLVLLTDLTQSCELLGKPLLVKKEDGTVLLNQRIAKIEINNSNVLNKQFLKNYFLTENYHKRIKETASGTTVRHSSNKILFETSLTIPLLPEQEKIASFLSEVDKSIELLEQEKELWEQYKKGMMQKIFSQKIRFKDENGNDYPEWKEKKLGEISLIQRGASPRPITDPKWFDDNSIIGWVRISDVTKSRKFLLKTEQYLSEDGIKKSRLIDKGNIIMSICATIGKPIYTNFNVCIHDGFVVFSNLTENKEFLYYFLEKIQNNWYKYGQPGTQVNLNSDIVSNELINIPSLPEQEKIADFLSAIDEKIETIVQELESSREFKKGLLQQMFV